MSKTLKLRTVDKRGVVAKLAMAMGVLHISMWDGEVNYTLHHMTMQNGQIDLCLTESTVDSPIRAEVFSLVVPSLLGTKRSGIRAKNTHVTAVKAPKGVTGYNYWDKALVLLVEKALGAVIQCGKIGVLDPNLDKESFERLCTVAVRMLNPE